MSRARGSIRGIACVLGYGRRALRDHYGRASMPHRSQRWPLVAANRRHPWTPLGAAARAILWCVTHLIDSREP